MFLLSRRPALTKLGLTQALFYVAIMGTATASPPASPPGPNGQSITRETVTITISAVSTALAFVFVSIRVCSSVLITRAMRYDDYACGLAMLGSIAYASTTIMTNVQDKSRESALFMNEITKGYLQQVFAGEILYAGSLCLTQVSLFLLYLRLFASSPRFRYQVYSGITISVIIFITGTMMICIACSPRQGQPWGSIAGLPRLARCSVQEKSFDVAAGAVGVVLDFYLLYLPLPVLWKLQLQRKKKIRVIAVFMTGSVACVAAITSFSLGIRLHLDPKISLNIDVINGVVPSVNMLELNIAIICGSIPAFACFVKHVKHMKPNKYSSIQIPPFRSSHLNLMATSSRKEMSRPPQHDNPFLESQLRETHIRAGSGTLESIWPEDTIPNGAIVQSFHVEISSSINFDGGDEVPAVPRDQEMSDLQYPRSVLRDESRE